MRKPKISAGYLRFSIIAVLIIAIVGVALGLGDTKPKPQAKPKLQTSGPCGDYRHDGNVVVNNQKINVEMPKDSTAFEKGLAGRSCILPDQGMFFAFNKPGQYPFWMKDMKFPIDIIWISAAHRVVAMEINESPKTYPDKFVNKVPAQYVLELKANRATDLHINLGTPVRF